MTALEQLIDWTAGMLNGGGNEDFIIGAELLPTDRVFQNAMLKANPNDGERQFLDSRREFTKYKTLYLRLDFTDDRARFANEAFLEELQKSIYNRNKRYELPSNDGRQWKSIECSGSPHTIAIDADGSTAIYSLTLKIIYEED
jgi:hypothetical protein